MPRLSDRAFYILKQEIENQRKICLDPIERFVLIARLERLRDREDKPLTQLELWDEVSDIAPDFDAAVLAKAASADRHFPVLGASVGAGAVIVLAAGTMGIARPPADSVLLKVSHPEPIVAETAVEANRTESAFETAKGIGWQAAVRGGDRQPKCALSSRKVGRNLQALANGPAQSR